MAINFPDSPSSGDTFTDATSGFTFEYNGTVWRSFDPSTVANIREIDDISGDFDGSDTTFTLKVAGVNVEPANVQQLIISVGGVMQNAGQDYTVSGSTLTFTTAPTSGLTFFGTILGTALALNTVSDDSVGSSSLKSEDFTIGGSGNTVTIPGNLTVQGTETIINTNELNVQDKTIGIGSTNAPTSATQDGAGAIIYGQTHIDILYDVDKAALGISTAVNVAGVVTATTLSVGDGSHSTNRVSIGDENDLALYHNGSNSFVVDRGTGPLYIRGNNAVRIESYTNDAAGEAMIVGNSDRSVEIYYDAVKRFETSGIGATVTGTLVSTAATIGTGVTINNTGIDAGIGAGIITAKTYFGDATNMTGAGSTFQALSSDPSQGKTIPFSDFGNNIVLTFNHGIEAGNADKEITLRKTSATGTIIQSFGVGSSVTYSFGQAIITPASGVITNEETIFVVVPDGAFKKIGTATSSSVINTYSFLSASFVRNLFAAGQSTYGIMGNDIGAPNQRRSSPIQIGADGDAFNYASVDKDNAQSAHWLKFVSSGNHELFSVGYMNDGQSGTNEYAGNSWQRSSPVQVGTENNWAMVSHGTRHSIGSKSDGTLWAWGYGDDGALGLNQSPGNQTRSSPTQIGGADGWSDQIVAGDAWNLATKTNGTLWSWGAGQSGKPLGQNSETNYSSPRQVGTDSTWSKLAKNTFNGSTVGAIKTNGTLWMWGHNTYGLLGMNNPDSEHRSSPCQIGTDTDWNELSISANQHHALATKTNGELYAWGRNNSGECGQNMTTTGFSSPTQIPGTDWTDGAGDQAFSAGGASSYASKTDGSMWAWGANGGGQLADNTAGPSGVPGRSSPIQVGSIPSGFTGGTGMGQGNDATSYFYRKVTN